MWLLLKIILMCVTISFASAAVPVHVSFETTSRSACELPEKIAIKLKTKEEKISLKLTRNDDVNEETDTFFLRHDGEEESVVMETPTSDDTTKSAEYQDEAHLASMSITCTVDDITADMKLEGHLQLSDGRQYQLSRDQGVDGSYSLHVQEETADIGDLADFVVDPDVRLIDVNVTSRVTLPTVYIDVVTLIDYSVYRKWASRSNNQNEALRKIKHHFAHMMNAINLRYKTASPNIHVVLAGYVIEDQGPGQWFESVRQTDSYYQNNVIDGQRLLSSVYRMSRSTRGFPQNDHVLTFTAYDMFTTGSNLLGIAYMQSVCRPGGMSVSVVEYNDRFTDDMLVATHEIGHGLSANHDGNGNGCQATSKYIMAPSYDGSHYLYNNNPHYFSSCSVQYIKSFISNLLQSRTSATCFRTKLQSQTVPDLEGDLPGQVYDVTEQCKQVNGQQSYYCNEPISASICKRMPCYNPSWRVCTRHSAADGTRCGNNRICRLGSCVTAPVRPPKKCTLRCPRGQKLDSKRCACIRATPTCRRRCQNGGTLDSRLCTCSCRGNYVGTSCGTCSRSCSKGYQMSPTECACVPVTKTCRHTCRNGGVINKSTCTCKCRGNYTGNACQYCARSCPRGQMKKQGQCECIPERCRYRDSYRCEAISRFNLCSTYYGSCPWSCGRCCEYIDTQQKYE